MLHIKEKALTFLILSFITLKAYCIVILYNTKTIQVLSFLILSAQLIKLFKHPGIQIINYIVQLTKYNSCIKCH
jgi:hypothetical protein